MWVGGYGCPEFQFETSDRQLDVGKQAACEETLPVGGC